MFFHIHGTRLAAAATGGTPACALVIADPGETAAASVDTAIGGSAVWLFVPYAAMETDFPGYRGLSLPDLSGDGGKA